MSEFQKPYTKQGEENYERIFRKNTMRLLTEIFGEAPEPDISSIDEVLGACKHDHLDDVEEKLEPDISLDLNDHFGWRTYL